MITVQVLVFGPLRDRLGWTERAVQVEPGSTIAELYLLLTPAEPRLPVAYVRNLERVDGGTALADGDQVGLLPPVGGG